MGIKTLIIKYKDTFLRDRNKDLVKQSGKRRKGQRNSMLYKAKFHHFIDINGLFETLFFFVSLPENMSTAS